MFNQLLVKSFTVEDKIFHVLCDMKINTDNLKNLGEQIIKFASDIEEEAKKKEEVVSEEEKQDNKTPEEGH